ADPNNLPIAVFKFQSLSLTGNPTIDTSNGGVTKLGLIGVDGITSGPPGGTLTFTGLDLLALATVNGSIDLTSDVSFQNLGTLANGANLTLDVTGDYANNSATELSRLRVTNEGAHIGTGGNINANIGGNLTTMSDFEAVVQNTNGQIDNGGNITLATGGSISTGGEFSLLIENYDETANPAGHIGTGGNLSLITGGNLTADFASIAINNRGGGMIDSGVSLTIDIAGAVTTMEDGPDFIGNPASLSL